MAGLLASKHMFLTVPSDNFIFCKNFPTVDELFGVEKTPIHFLILIFFLNNLKKYTKLLLYCLLIIIIAEF